MANISDNGHCCTRALTPHDKLPQRHEGAVVAGSPRSITSGSASCTWSAILIVVLPRRHVRAAGPRRAADPKHTVRQVIIDADTYNQVFTLHGAIMVFLFIIPAIPAALGNFVLPMMLGAKDVAFPRLNLAQLLHLRGRARCSRSTPIITGGVDTGWTFYTPYSTTHQRRGRPDDAGGVSSSASRRSSPASTSSSRSTSSARPAWAGSSMPLFIWGIYATASSRSWRRRCSAITLLLLLDRARLQHRHLRSDARRRPGAVPALLLVLLAPGRLHHDPAGHGDHQRDHPDVLAQDDLRLHGSSRSRRVAHRAARLPRLGPPHVRQRPVASSRAMVFSSLTFLVAIPSGVKVFNWVATMYKGNISLDAPMLYALCVPAAVHDRRPDRAVPRHALASTSTCTTRTSSSRTSTT